MCDRASILSHLLFRWFPNQSKALNILASGTDSSLIVTFRAIEWIYVMILVSIMVSQPIYTLTELIRVDEE